jgi:tRNA threonylcarbamoyl adenosine modification protein YeaZ
MMPTPPFAEETPEGCRSTTFCPQNVVPAVTLTTVCPQNAVRGSVVAWRPYPRRVLVLAIDTATPAVTAGIVELRPESATVLAEHVTVDPRAHGELLTPHVLAAARDAGVHLREIDAIACGAGPGPYTGLRAGMVTAAALSESLGVPAHPVCSLDAIAAGTRAAEPFLVVTDARRREVYWAAYDSVGARTSGPHVNRPAELDSSLHQVAYAHPSPRGIVSAARDVILGGRSPEQLTPQYLRRPDAAAPHPPKRVTAS